MKCIDCKIKSENEKVTKDQESIKEDSNISKEEVQDFNKKINIEQNEIKTKESNEKKDNKTLFSELWVCASCGMIRCGRTTDNQHSVKHNEKQPDHSITINLQSLNIWCFLCDEFIEITSIPTGLHIFKVLKIIRNVLNYPASILSKNSTLILENNKKKGKQQKSLGFSSNLHSQESDLIEDSLELQKILSINSLTSKELTEGKSNVLQINRAGFSSSLMSSGVRGLRNLGNTCFFNAVLQNLFQLSLLKNYLLRTVTFEESTNTTQDKIQIKGVNGDGLTETLRKSFVSVWCGPEGKTFSPSTLFTSLISTASRFRGYHQQDSHELLRYLLDGIQNEYLNSNKTTLGKNLKKKLQRRNESHLIPGDEQYKTFVERIFGGKLTSTITCHSCKNKSYRTEPFLDVSLPIPSFYYYENSEKNRSDSKKINSQNQSLSRKQQRKLNKHNIVTTQKNENNSEIFQTNKLKEKEELFEQRIINEDMKLKIEKEKSLEGCLYWFTNPELLSLSNSFQCENCAKILKSTNPNHPSIINSKKMRENNKIKSKSINTSKDNNNNNYNQQKKKQNKNNSSNKKNKSINQNSDEEKDQENEDQEKDQENEDQEKDQEYEDQGKGYQENKIEREIKKLEKKEEEELGEGEEENNSEEWVLRDATKQLSISKLPNVLTVHIKRFQQTVTGSLKKLNLPISFPIHLDLSPFCDSELIQNHKNQPKEDIYHLFSITPPSLSSNSSSINEHTNSIKSPSISDIPLSPNMYSPESSLNSSLISSIYDSSLETNQQQKQEQEQEQEQEQQKQQHKQEQQEQEQEHKHEKEKISPFLYKLSGIVEHAGGMGGGHYVSYVYCKSRKKWFYFSDSSLNEVSENNVLSSEAYLLFYEQLSSLSILPSLFPPS